MLATLLSTPCAGPLLIPVITFAIGTGSRPIIFSTCTAVGLGMSFPYVVLAWNPGWMKIMPKPGEWMRTFKELMGFLLLGTAVWLLWQRRKDGELVVWTVAFSVFVGLAGWLYGRWSDPLKSTAKRLAAPIIALAIIAVGGYFCFAVMYVSPSALATTETTTVVEKQTPSRLVDGFEASSYHWQPFRLEAVLAAGARGQTVVVDWTADW
jgi:thiol:disulfide interchange protein DsbD